MAAPLDTLELDTVAWVAIMELVEKHKLLLFYMLDNPLTVTYISNTFRKLYVQQPDIIEVTLYFQLQTHGLGTTTGFDN